MPNVRPCVTSVQIPLGTFPKYSPPQALQHLDPGIQFNGTIAA